MYRSVGRIFLAMVKKDEMPNHSDGFDTTVVVKESKAEESTGSRYRRLSISFGTSNDGGANDGNFT